MKFRQFTNEKGMTLVELLAALSLFAVVIALSSTVIIQLVSSESNASDDISLNKETNLLISDMRSDYQNKLENTNDNETFNICFHNKTIEIIELVIDDESISIEDGCTTQQFGKQDNIHIKLTTQNSREKFELETTFIADIQLPITIAIEKDNEGEETGEDDLEEIEKDDPDSYKPGDTHPNWDQWICDFSGNTKFSQTQIGSWNACEYTRVQNGDAWFTNNISIFQGMHLLVDKNLFIDEVFNLERDAHLSVGNNAKLEGNSILKSKSSMEVINLYALDNFTVQEQAFLHSKGSLRVNGSLKLMSLGKMTINDSLFALSDTTFQENTNINIGKNASFKEDVNLMSNAGLTIEGNAAFYQNLNFQENSKVTIKGDALFKNNLTPEWGAGLMCIEGNASFEKDLPDNLKPVVTSECFKPAGHKIYIKK